MADFVTFCRLFCTLFIFQKPCDLGSREIRRKIHSGFLADHFCCAGLFHAGTDIYCAGALPYNCISVRFACNAVPCKRGFTLVADSQTNYIFLLYSLQKLFHNLQDIAVNFLRIMGNPALFVDDLSVWTVSPAHNASCLIEKERLGTLGTLIYTDNIFCHVYYPLKLLYSLQSTSLYLKSVL